MDAYETVRVIGYGSYGSAVLVRARVTTNSNTAPGHGGGDAATQQSQQQQQQQQQPQQPQQHPHAPPSPPVGRQFVIKQIRLAALEHDSGRDEAGAAAQPSGPSVSVSVSVPPPSPLSAGLINEVQVLMRVGASRHPNICRYRDSFLVPADDGPTRSELLCIVMDHYAGGDLARKIRQRLRQQLAAAGAAQQNESLRSSNSSISSVASTGIVPQPPPPPPLLALFSEDTVIDCLVQLALGLKHCHDQGVLHRDLKTSNIFISNEPARSFHPRPARSQPHTPSQSASSSQAQPPSHPPDYVEVLRIGDFGIARMLDAVNPLAHTRVGTPYSLAPEVCEGRAYSFEADMWSLGCVLYELLTGRHAFNAPSLGELVIAITRGTYGPVPNVYSSRIHQLLRALLQKEPERRPTVTQLLSVPFMRDRIPFWLSHRRILVEFGGELSRLPEFQLAPLFPLPSPMRSRSTSAHHSVRPREPQSASSTSTAAAAAGAGASGSRSGRDPTERSSSKPGPPCSLVIPPRSMLTAAASTTAAGAVSESATPSPMPQSHAQAQGRIEPQTRPRAASASSASSLLDRLTVLQTPRPQPTQQRQPLTPPSTFSSGACHDQRRSPCAAPRGASSTASGSGSGGSSDSSAVGGVARVTTPISSSVVSSSSGHSRAHSSSTPSPLPVLRFHPLALTPLPLPQQSRPATPAVTAIDRTLVPSSSSDSHIAADSSTAPSTPSSAALVTVPSSVSSFAWRVPAAFAAALGASAPSSSASAAPPPPASLSLQCERVRAWLEQQIQFGTLKRAYDLMREQSAEPPAADGDGEAKGGGGEPHSAAAAAAAASSSSRSAHDSRVLQVLQLSQTHLITLMQQLVQAERVQEEG